MRKLLPSFQPPLKEPLKDPYIMHSSSSPSSPSSPWKTFSRNKITSEIIGFGIAILIALLIRTFFIQPFHIPSGSMYPTLEVGDFIFVSKYDFGYSNHSLPLAPPLIKDRLFGKLPKRGDVLVFAGTKDDRDYIKRLVGLPGDKIQMIKGVLHINGEAVKLKRIEDYQMLDSRGRWKVIPQYIETLPGGVKHPILKEAPMGQGHLDETEVFTVPDGHFFMMGDNRDNSDDSRAMNLVDFIPFKNLMGKAKFIFFSTEAKWYELKNWLTGLRFNRVCTTLA